MTDKGDILAVDDTPASLKLLTEILKAEGYEVRAAISGELALRSANSNPPELVLLDIRMPTMDGLEVCRRLKAEIRTRDVPVIFVSALSESGDVVQCFNVGGVDYVSKPYRREELLARVRTHLEMNRLRNHLGEMLEERTSELRASEKKLKENLLHFGLAMGSLVEMREPHIIGHQRRVANLATALALEMQLPEDRIAGLNLICVMHDIGEFSISTDILGKRGPLSEIDFDLLKQHPQQGYELLKEIDFPWPIATTVLQHHERIDGSGYPHGLIDREIILEAKILAVADVMEAMVSRRPYRAGMGIEAALQEIVRHRGIFFDAAVVDACVRLFQDRGYRFPAPDPKTDNS